MLITDVNDDAMTDDDVRSADCLLLVHKFWDS